MKFSKFLSGLGLMTLTAMLCFTMQSAFSVKSDYGEVSTGTMDPFIGEIVAFSGNFAPRGWAFCEGQLLAISQNTALFSLLGTMYGGDGRTTFGLPDLRGRSPIQSGNGPGLSSHRQGQKGGVDQATLNTLHLPSHDHEIKDEALNSLEKVSKTEKTVVGNGSSSVMLVDPGTGVKYSTTGNGGNGQAVDIRNPYLGINYIIALQGVYPSRN